jgi:hypothetical protein
MARGSGGNRGVARALNVESRAVGKFADFIKAPLALVFTPSRKEAACADHLIREHHRGRALADIMQDAYITNRLSPEQAQRLLDRPEVLHAFGEDMIAAHRQAGGTTPTGS